MNWKEGVGLVTTSKSRLFLCGCGFFILGILISLSLGGNRSILLRMGYFLFLLILFFLTLFWPNITKRKILILIGLLVIGFLRGVFSLPVFGADHVASLVNNKTEIVGTVLEIQNSIDGRAYVLQPDNYRGKILVNAPLYPRYDYGDRLQVACKFDFPDVISYARYLKIRNIFTTCGFGKIEKVGEGGGNFLGRLLANWRIYLEEKISSLWPEPRASLMAGILYGERGSIPPELKKSFSGAGLSHIVAVSGYNTSVIALMLMSIFIFVGFWRRQAFWSSGMGLILFTLFTGASASVVRAAVMAIFVMVGNYLGRPARMINSISLSAALMLLVTPLIILDVGFQLSFISTIGVAYVGPIFSKRFKTRLPEVIAELLFATLGALSVTLPLTIYYFGQVPLLALLANILVVGFIPIIMLLGFLGILISFLSLYLALPVIFAADVGLRYIIGVSENLSTGSVGFQLPLAIVILIYIFLVIWFYRLNKYVRQNEN